MEESNVQPVRCPVTVCGDIHGQFVRLSPCMNVRDPFAHTERLVTSLSNPPPFDPSAISTISQNSFESEATRPIQTTYSWVTMLTVDTTPLKQ